MGFTLYALRPTFMKSTLDVNAALYAQVAGLVLA
jgi:hypothetical protein